jgi:CubicO group peptidase (beta-lactamase class C family)
MASGQGKERSLNFSRKLMGLLPFIIFFIVFLSKGIFAMEKGFEWQTASPESQGMSMSKLDALRDTLAAKDTKTFLVIRHDKIVYEWYAPGYGPKKLHYTASLAKALVGGVSLMVALNDGRLTVDDPAWKYIPAWKGHPQKSNITIRHLATHSSGIEDAEESELPHEQLSGWKGDFWKRSPDPFSIAKDKAPVVFPPGSKYAYSNSGMAMLAYAVTASLKDTPQPDIRTLLRERIMKPIGVPDEEWSIGYGRGYEVDGLTLYANWGGGAYTARAVARVGRLMLRKGNWEGRQLVDSIWVEKAVAYAGTPLPDRSTGKLQPGSGLGWWTNFDGVWAKVPRDAFAGAGAGNQILLVIPSLDLIVVRNGELLGEGFWDGLEKYLFNPLIEAIVEPPYPQSNVIQSVTFAPVSSIVRNGIDSDNWPITWADDDNQYTAYGDGWGFEPRTEKKLSLGFAKIIGSPTDFHGVNVRSESGERIGDGANGPKASGMLMVDGVLYMWVRNMGNSRLVWSEDYARTWKWGFGFDISFGCPTFLNFGKNYEGARDEYVYIYSQDGPSAYESYDHVVMARVPKDKIKNRDAYQFFEKLDSSGNPVWTSDIHRRGPVFTHRNGCQRMDVVYNPGIKRYLLAMGFDHHGGWGIFDAPELWGPWTTAFYTKDWGLGDTHGYRLPSKWISADGKTMYLVFSGRTHNNIIYDAFCVRKLDLNVK